MQPGPQAGHRRRPRGGEGTGPHKRGLAVLLADPPSRPAAKNTRLIPAAQEKITAARRKLDAATAARDTIPAKLPANVIDPEAQVAVLRAGRRGLQMVLRLLAHNAEHWLASHLNAYLRDDDEYRPSPPDHHPRPGRHHHQHPRRDHRHSRNPRPTPVARALALLLDEINHTPPAIPGDPGPSPTSSPRTQAI